jgi:16S rRNA (cytosine967-C5)-methyltransferase
MTQSSKRARELVHELWTRTRIDWGFASARIADAFRREKGLGARERRWVAETLYGMIRLARKLDFALEGVRLAGDARDAARVIAFELWEGEIDLAAAAKEMPNVDWARVAAVDERIDRERDEVVRLGLKRSLPDWLARVFLDEYGEKADALLAALNQRAPLTLRVNTLLATRDEVLAKLAEAGLVAHATRWSPVGIALDTRVNVFGTDVFREGLVEVQDEASQLVCELVAPPPRAVVVDACAGAGGKTLALGALAGGKGRLVALDVEERKLEELRRRARRAKLTNVQAIAVGPAGGYPDEVEALRGKADRVLVDAPCSGLGSLRRNPELRWRLTPDDLERLPREQEAIARRAAALVGPGGRLVYATCTLLRRENQAVVERLSDLGFIPMRAAEIWGTERALALGDVTATYLETRPDRHDTDGFFAAVLRRNRA